MIRVRKSIYFNSIRYVPAYYQLTDKDIKENGLCWEKQKLILCQHVYLHYHNRYILSTYHMLSISLTTPIIIKTTPTSIVGLSIDFGG